MGKILNIGAFRLNTHCRSNVSGNYFRIIDIPNLDQIRLLNIHNKKSYLLNTKEIELRFSVVNFALLTKIRDKVIKSIDALLDHNNRIFYKENRCQK